jgi:predicted nuclease with TOPRIM domain
MNPPSEAEIEARFQAMAAQRNAALDECVFLSGQVSVLQQEVARILNENAQLKEAAVKPEDTNDGH